MIYDLEILSKPCDFCNNISIQDNKLNLQDCKNCASKFNLEAVYSFNAPCPIAFQEIGSAIVKSSLKYENYVVHNTTDNKAMIFQLFPLKLLFEYNSNIHPSNFHSKIKTFLLFK